MTYPEQEVEIDYTNWRGQRSTRKIQPLKIVFGTSAFHPDGEQWFLEAVCVDRGVNRSFAIQDIHSWEPIDA